MSAGAIVTPQSHVERRAPGRFALSVDVEDYFQVWAFSGAVKRSSWDGFSLRAENSTRRLLDMFDDADTKATFFVLGWIAERAPGLVREIVARGHEIASHGYEHVKVFDQSPKEFRIDAWKSKRLIEDVAGARVRGYRAAGFSIDARTPWAYEILGELGHEYSSSSHPIAHDHYGDSGAPRSAHMMDGVIEAPVATVDWHGRRFSCAGGGWFRAAPYPFFRRMLTSAESTINGPAIFYLHPWEIDPQQPRISAAPLKSKLRHYLNLTKTEGKLARLLDDFRWSRIDECLNISDRRAAA